MPSQRNSLGEFNVNNSKNTRMEMTKSFEAFDFRKDEIMHLGRYNNSAQTMVDVSKKLGRPIRVLDIGCGEMNTIRLFYVSFLTKKTDVIESYTGIDIDYKMVEKAKEKYGNAYEKCNADYLIKDLTVDPHIDVEDNSIDLVICFEFLEHIQPKFAPDILKEVFRVLNPEGKALFSTPNSNGSSATLPKDHIYEYSYEELLDMFRTAGFDVTDTVGVCLNISRIPKEVKEQEEYKHYLRLFYDAYGVNTSFASVALAPLFPPEYCKNVVYHLNKPM